MGVIFSKRMPKRQRLKLGLTRVEETDATNLDAHLFPHNVFQDLPVHFKRRGLMRSGVCFPFPFAVFVFDGPVPSQRRVCGYLVGGDCYCSERRTILEVFNEQIATILMHYRMVRYRRGGGMRFLIGGSHGRAWV